MMKYLTALFVATTLASVGAAQDTTPAPRLSVELNAADTTEGGCRLSFLIQNSHAEDLQVIFETVLFTAEGTVAQLTLFDFGTLPSQRPRVRQFDVPGLPCEGLGSLLINGATTCEAASLSPSICDETLVLSSRTRLEMLG